MGRDKYGNYVNEKRVTIKVEQDKNRKDHVSFYDGPVDGDHSAVHVNVDYIKSVLSVIMRNTSSANGMLSLKRQYIKSGNKKRIQTVARLSKNTISKQHTERTYHSKDKGAR